MGIFDLYCMLIALPNKNKEQSRDLGAAGVALAGALTGSSVWFLSYPFDIVKTIVQTSGA
jgi:hypothetical protein